MYASRVLSCTIAPSGQPLHELVAGGQEEHRRLHALRSQRLAEIAAVRVRKADVDDEGVGRARDRPAKEVGARGRALRAEPLLGEAANENPAQLSVILDDQYSRFHHSSRRIQPNRSREM